MKTKDKRKKVDIVSLNSELECLVEQENNLRSKIEEVLSKGNELSDSLISEYCPNGVDYMKLPRILFK